MNCKANSSILSNKVLILDPSEDNAINQKLKTYAVGAQDATKGSAYDD
jgi:hypothetical protein